MPKNIKSKILQNHDETFLSPLFIRDRFLHIPGVYRFPILGWTNLETPQFRTFTFTVASVCQNSNSWKDYYGPEFPSERPEEFRDGNQYGTAPDAVKISKPRQGSFPAVFPNITATDIGEISDCLSAAVAVPLRPSQRFIAPEICRLLENDRFGLWHSISGEKCCAVLEEVVHQLLSIKKEVRIIKRSTKRIYLTLLHRVVQWKVSN